jgi:hypothetical protein
MDSCVVFVVRFTSLLHGAGLKPPLVFPTCWPRDILVHTSATCCACHTTHQGKPVLRVILNHFAVAGNVGAVAAKEEVWEVSAQLAGYAASVAVLAALQDAGRSVAGLSMLGKRCCSPMAACRASFEQSLAAASVVSRTGRFENVAGVWALVQGAHVAFRFLALKQLRFRSLNPLRAAAILRAHVCAMPLPSVAAANAAEPLLPGKGSVTPLPARLGITLAEAWDQQQLGSEFEGWLQLYEGRGYLLTWRDGIAYVLLREPRPKPGSGVNSGGGSAGVPASEVLLQALWQTAWLEAAGGDLNPGSRLADDGSYGSNGHLELLSASLNALDKHFSSFISEASELGWDTRSLYLRVEDARLLCDD